MDTRSGLVRHRRRRSLTAGRRAVLIAVALAGITVLAGACGGASPLASVANLASPTSRSGKSDPAPTPTASPNLLAFAQCMRSHGLPDFPEPNAQGQIELQGGPGSDLDPQSPTFQSAQQACQSLQPNGGQPTAAQQQQMQQQALAFAQCMRANGVANFPDPTFKNGGVFMGGSAIDPNSPSFQAAQKACQSKLPGLPAGGGTTSQSGAGSGGQFQIGVAP